MLESTLADEAEEFLQPGNSDDARAAKSFQRIVGEFAFADVAADLAVEVVGGEAEVAHGSGFHSSDASAEGVFLADGSGDDLLVVHLDVGEEVLWQVGAVEADGLVGIVAV